MTELPLKVDMTKAAIDYLEKQGYTIVKQSEISDKNLYAIANMGSDMMDAYTDCEAYLPPDESESWIDADRLLAERDRTEADLRKFINDLINCGLWAC